MHPQLLPIRQGLDSCSDWLSRLAEWAGEEHWAAKPTPDSWSASECVQHLNATSRAMVPLILRQLETSRRKEPMPGYRLSFVGWLILRSLSSPAKKKYRTTDAFLPPEPKSPKTDLIAWAVCQSDVGDALERADGHPLHRLKIVSPFNARIRYNVYSAFRIIVAHEQRHLDQAEKAIEAVRRG
jgi:hypothetical protein